MSEEISSSYTLQGFKEFSTVQSIIDNAAKNSENSICLEADLDRITG